MQRQIKPAGFHDYAERESYHMKQEMLINVSQPEECRIAIVEDGVLEELYIERTSQDNYVGNIYKGRVVNIEPSIQAAFVDFGVGRNGFLHISDVEPQYFRQGGIDPDKPLAPWRPRRLTKRPRTTTDEASHGPRGNAVHGLARGRGSSRRFKTSSAAATSCWCRSSRKASAPRGRRSRTYISIPGRYLVLMPALGRVGVSRKIEDEDARRKLRDMMLELNPPKGLGFIVRTAGVDRTKKELSRDLAYLLAAVEGDRPPHQEARGAGRYLRRKRHDHPHDPRHLHGRRRLDLHRRADVVRAGEGVLADRHAAVRRAGCICTKAKSRCSTTTGSTKRSCRSISARCRCGKAARS